MFSVILFRKIEDMLNEVKFSTYVDNGKYVNEIDLGEIIRRKFTPSVCLFVCFSVISSIISFIRLVPTAYTVRVYIRQASSWFNAFCLICMTLFLLVFSLKRVAHRMLITIPSPVSLSSLREPSSCVRSVAFRPP